MFLWKSTAAWRFRRCGSAARYCHASARPLPQRPCLLGSEELGALTLTLASSVALAPRRRQAKQNNLYVLHDVDTLRESEEVCRGLFLGGWSDARPKVADRSLGEGRFKFFLGATEWDAGQLEDEFKAGAWLALDAEPGLVIKDRVASWRPGRPKPVWTEFMKHLAEDGKKIVDQVYPEGADDS